MLAEITPGLFSQVTCFTIVPVAQCDNCNLDEVLLMQDTPQYITAGQVDMYIKTTNIYENMRLKGRFVLIQTHGNITTQELLNFGVYFF